MELVFEPEADRALTALERDPTRKQLTVRVHAALRSLAANPGDARCRQLPYMPFGWGMRVRTRNDDLLIIWRAGPGEHQVTVRYVGPDI